MIHPDCATCEMLDLDNEDFPCKLELYGSILRCNILNEYAKTEGIKRELLEDGF
jgi:hypothetical protein